MIRLPGRIYETFNERAQVKLAFGQDVDVCDALSRPRIKQRGRGWTVYLDLTSDQIRRMADWIKADDRKVLRDYCKALLLAADKTAERETEARKEAA